MGTTIAYRKVVARKQHICNWCNCRIEKGSTYVNQFIKGDESFTWKNHLHCAEIADKLKMFDECDEGLSEEDFVEYIKQEFYRLFGEEDNFLNTHLTFESKLKSVCKHYKIEI